MTAVKADLDVLKNKGVVSSCKSVQRGDLQKPAVIYYNRNETNPYYTVSFPISQINLEKSFWLHETTVTPKTIFTVEVSEIKTTITSNSIEVKFKGEKKSQNASTADSTVTVSCNWQIIEFY